MSTLTDTDDDAWRRVFAVNCDGTFYCCRRAIPRMLRQGWGRIITVGSVQEAKPHPDMLVYSASKAALIGLTKALAKEMGPSNIRVNCVAPGVIDTDMNRNLDPADFEALRDETPLCRIGTPEEVAEAILFLASDKSSFITGAVLGVNGGLLI